MNKRLTTFTSNILFKLNSQTSKENINESDKNVKDKTENNKSDSSFFQKNELNSFHEIVKYISKNSEILIKKVKYYKFYRERTLIKLIQLNNRILKRENIEKLFCIYPSF